MVKKDGKWESGNLKLAAWLDVDDDYDEEEEAKEEGICKKRLSFCNDYRR